MGFGQNIIEAQERKGIKTLPLCRKTGISRSTIRNWRKLDKTSYTEVINKLCKELGITPNELFSYGEYQWHKHSNT